MSPTITTEDEVIALRAENKVLRQALKAVEDTATEQLKKSFELVWFARNRCKCTHMQALVFAPTSCILLVPARYLYVI